MSELILYSTFEEISSEFESDKLNAKLMEFIEPLPEVEAEINEITSSLGNSGKVVFILGKPGTGKSTFIQSLGWRPHVKARTLVQINANDYISEGNLSALFSTIQTYEREARERRDKGVTCLVINYLEYLDDFEDDDVKGFFRKLNGILRNAPIFIIWPATEESDVYRMLEHSKSVSGTLFYRGKEIIRFSGPKTEKFADIALRTISVLNDGKELSEFGLTYDDLTEVRQTLQALPEVDRTMREYLEILKERWRKASDYQSKLRSKIPKSTEVWFVFSYKDAESIVAQFIRKSSRSEDNWSVIHDKLYEYIHEGNQRSSIWNAKKLQLALYGALKTRILFLPTNTLISCVASYSGNSDLIELLKRADMPEGWKDKFKAKRSLKKSPIYKQLIGESFQVGMRKGKPAADALLRAELAFLEMVKWVTGAGSDKEINRSLAQAITDCGSITASSETRHPWIPNIVPDIFIDLPHKQICIEFHYTSRDEPGIVADYVLKKLNIYMNQLESLINESTV